MIGNAYPWRDSGFVIVEEGEIDPVTLGLNVRAYHVIDRYGRRVASDFATLQAAGDQIDVLCASTVDGRRP